MTNTDFTIEADELSASRYSFHLSPKLWDQYRGPDDLQWQSAPFRRRSLATLPNVPGVYAFCVRPSIAGNLCGSYLLYVGQTVHLRTRCQQYLRAAERQIERPKILRMLRLFFGTDYLHFCFAVVTNDDPAIVEQSLLEVTVPPACQALPATVRPAVQAFPY